MPYGPSGKHDCFQGSAEGKGNQERWPRWLRNTCSAACARTPPAWDARRGNPAGARFPSRTSVQGRGRAAAREQPIQLQLAIRAHQGGKMPRGRASINNTIVRICGVSGSTSAPGERCHDARGFHAATGLRVNGHLRRSSSQMVAEIEATPVMRSRGEGSLIGKAPVLRRSPKSASDVFGTAEN